MTSTNSVASIEDQYQLYLAEYGKTVSNDEEYQTRLRIFADNLKAIEEINSKQSSYKVAINKFADVIPKDNLGYTPSSAQSYHNYMDHLLIRSTGERREQCTQLKIKDLADPVGLSLLQVLMKLHILFKGTPL